jgi:glycosyltransferase involved in cell wall biosynthesis
MYQNKKIGIIVPAYNVENLIRKVIETMPKFVDLIIVVNDASNDKTAEIIKSYQRQIGERLILIEHQKNLGVGGAIISGYKKAKELNIDVSVVMAGDAQMDPNDLEAIIKPITSNVADYSKGNRLFTGQSWKIIPKLRYFGNSLLSLLTKIASGYWGIADSQCGYTAISLETLKKLNLDKIYKRYGFPNDILVRLNVVNARVCDVPVRPVYNIGEKSGIKVPKMLLTGSLLLIKLFFWRLKEKYVIRDFHPLVFFYLISFILFPIGFVLMGIFLWKLFTYNYVSVASAVISTLCIISATQMTLFAMWFDMDNNRHLNINIFDKK